LSTLDKRVVLGHAAPSRPLHRMLEDQLHTVLAAVGRDIDASRLLAGDPAAELATASAGLDLLALGSRGCGRVGTGPVGSVSGAVVHAAHCPS
jgi:nucleotide-binding universal stress UspA family protein